jgi:hypothetical protein
MNLISSVYIHAGVPQMVGSTESCGAGSDNYHVMQWGLLEM